MPVSFDSENVVLAPLITGRADTAVLYVSPNGDNTTGEIWLEIQEI